MPTLSLPVELHKPIIDKLGSELEADHEQDVQHCRKCLQDCALVCRQWCTYTLPYRFGSLKLPVDSRRSLSRRLQVERLRSLVQLMGSNPRIGSSARSVVFSANVEDPKLDEALYQAVLHLQAVVNLTVICHYDRWFGARPFFHNAISILLRGAQLQHLTFTKCTTFRTSSIAMSLSLKSLTIEKAENAVVDRTGDPYPLPSLQKLVLISSDIILDTMRLDSRLRAVFKNVHHLEISFNLIRPPTWQDTFDWTNMQSLTLSSWVDCKSRLISFPARRADASIFTVPIDERFGSFYAEVPWSSLSRLTSLSLAIIFHGPYDWTEHPDSWFNLHSVPHILSGAASHLGQLRTLEIMYIFSTMTFLAEEWVERSLRELLGECLDPSFEQRSAFSSLESFSTSVYMMGSPRLLRNMDRAGFLARTMEHLPSIFGPGGRAEVDGWKAFVNGDLSIDPDYAEFSSLDTV